MYRSRDAVIDRFREDMELLGSNETVVLAIEEHGERVLIVIRFEGASTGAGAPFVQRWVYVYDFAESGRISRWRVFGDLDEARRTARAPG
jgi:ketosteroid isomerase-like protein